MNTTPDQSPATSDDVEALFADVSDPMWRGLAESIVKRTRWGEWQRNGGIRAAQEKAWRDFINAPSGYREALRQGRHGGLTDALRVAARGGDDDA